MNISMPWNKVIDIFATNCFYRLDDESFDWENSSEETFLVITEVSLLDAVLNARKEVNTGIHNSGIFIETRKDKGSSVLFSKQVSSSSSSSSSSPVETFNKQSTQESVNGLSDVISNDVHMSNASIQLPPLRKLSSASTTVGGSTNILKPSLKRSKTSPLQKDEREERQEERKEGKALISSLALAMRFDTSIQKDVLEMIKKASLPQIPTEHSISSQFEALLQRATQQPLKSTEESSSPFFHNLNSSSSSSSSTSPFLTPPHSSTTSTNFHSSTLPPPDLSTLFMTRIFSALDANTLARHSEIISSTSISTTYSSKKFEDKNEEEEDKQERLYEKLKRRILLLHSVVCSEAARRRVCALIVELCARGYTHLAVTISRWVPICQTVFEFDDSTDTNEQGVDTSVDTILEKLRVDGEWLEVIEHEQKAGNNNNYYWLPLTKWSFPYKVCDECLNLLNKEKISLPYPRFTLTLDSQSNKSDLLLAYAAKFILEGYLEMPFSSLKIKHPSSVAEFLVLL